MKVDSKSLPGGGVQVEGDTSAHSLNRRVRVVIRARPTQNLATRVFEFNSERNVINVRLPRYHSSLGSSQKDHRNDTSQQDLDDEQLSQEQEQSQQAQDEKQGQAQKQQQQQQQEWSFKFDSVFTNTSQDAIYEQCADSVVNSVLGGYNGTILTYGQTGAGKTFTMTGISESFKQRGLIPRAFGHIFRETRSRPHSAYSVSVSYFEIYNETIYDLLRPTNQQQHQPFDNFDQKQKQNKESSQEFSVYEDRMGTHVRGLTQIVVTSEEEALACLFEGESNRTIGSHVLNLSSSRSHAVLTVHVETKSRLGGMSGDTTVSKLCLVDLAGSERPSKTNPVGSTFKEATFINKSLTFLEQVILALSDKHRDHIPYRQSRLTSVLRDSLGGNCITVMIANIWPDIAHIEETVSTLRFASRTMCVTNDPVVNIQHDSTSVIKRQEREIKDLRRELAALDTLNGRAVGLHEPLTETQKQEIARRVRVWLDTVDSDLDLVTLREAREALNTCKTIYMRLTLDLNTAAATITAAGLTTWHLGQPAGANTILTGQASFAPAADTGSQGQQNSGNGLLTSVVGTGLQAHQEAEDENAVGENDGNSFSVGVVAGNLANKRSNRRPIKKGNQPVPPPSITVSTAASPTSPTNQTLPINAAGATASSVVNAAASGQASASMTIPVISSAATGIPVSPTQSPTPTLPSSQQQPTAGNAITSAQTAAQSPTNARAGGANADIRSSRVVPQPGQGTQSFHSGGEPGSAGSRIRGSISVSISSSNTAPVGTDLTGPLLQNDPRQAQNALTKAIAAASAAAAAAAASGSNATTVPTGNLGIDAGVALRPDKEVEFEKYKLGAGKDVASMLAENKRLVLEKHSRAQILVELLRELREELIETRNSASKERAEVIEATPGHPTRLELEGYPRLAKLVERLGFLREEYARLMNDLAKVKQELSYASNSVAQLREQLVLEFDAWYSSMYLAVTPTQVARQHSRALYPAPIVATANAADARGAGGLDDDPSMSAYTAALRRVQHTKRSYQAHSNSSTKSVDQNTSLSRAHWSRAGG